MKNRIVIVGLGPGSEEYLTLGSLRTLENADCLILRTEHHAIVPFLKEQNISFTTLDYIYKSAKDFDDLNEKLSDALVASALENEEIVFAVPGHGILGDAAVEKLLEKTKDEGIQVQIIPGVSQVDFVVSHLDSGGLGSLCMLPAGDIQGFHPNPRIPLIIIEITSAVAAGEVKIKLMEHYPAEHPVTVIVQKDMGGADVRQIPLYQLDQMAEYNHTFSAFVREVSFSQLERYDFGHLIEVMRILRSPEGCPWDREQTYESLKRYMIEEAYEVLEAIDEKDVDKLIGELGDVLLQVVFHSQVGSERGEFHIGDVTTGICRKMIDRHPHIFGDTKVQSSDEVLSNWEAIKKKEKGLENYTQVLKDIPSNLPALMRSYKVQEKAALVGFDWDSIYDALSKVDEEVEEFRVELEKASYGEENEVSLGSELGDLLFAVVNVARFLEIQPELILTAATEKFIRRFQYIEEKAAEAGRTLEDMNLEEMDKLWNQSKSLEK